MLFVIAGGNTGTCPQGTGADRVQVPADMANGISVGACDATPPKSPWQRAEYSSVGPGRHGNMVQPTEVQFGGTDNDQFLGLQVGGTLLGDCGSSYATALVTHALADLAARLPSRKATPEALRAFAVHFAERHPHWRKQIHNVGHGRFPLDFEPLLDCLPNEIHVLFTDTIDSEGIQGYTVPVPKSAVGPLEFRVTLAYVSPVEPNSATEYTKVALEISFRPHGGMFRFSPPTSVAGTRSIECDISTAQASDLSLRGWKMSSVPVTKPMTRSRVSNGVLLGSGSWETLRHYRTKMNVKNIKGPTLEIRCSARHAGGQRATLKELPFAILVTVADQDSSTTFYDQVRQQYRTLNVIPRTRARAPRERSVI